MNLFKLCMMYTLTVYMHTSDKGNAVFTFEKATGKTYQYTIKYIDRIEVGMDILEKRMCELVNKHFSDEERRINSMFEDTLK